MVKPYTRYINSVGFVLSCAEVFFSSTLANGNKNHTKSMVGVLLNGDFFPYFLYFEHTFFSWQLMSPNVIPFMKWIC